MKESPQFKLLIDTPGIGSSEKIKTLDAICQKMKADPAIINFVKVLIENKRLSKLTRMINLYESFYRAEMGLVLCQVASAEPLSSKQQTAVKAAMEKRAEKGSTLLERLQTQLLAPVLG